MLPKWMKISLPHRVTFASFLLTLHASVLSSKTIEVEVSSTADGWHMSLGSFSASSYQEYGLDPFCQQQIAQEGNGTASSTCFADSSLTKEKEGLVLTVINERSGTVTLQKVFHTWEFWIHWSNLIWYVENIPSGRIVVLSFSGEGSIGLRYAVSILSALGSLWVQNLFARTNWIWIFVKSGRTIFEGSSLIPFPPIHTRVALYLLSFKKPDIKSSLDALRWKICDSTELMGDLCEEDNQTALKIIPHLNVTFSNLANIPIVVTAGSRPYYFLFSMKRLLSAPGINRSSINVLVGGDNKLYQSISKLLSVRYSVLQNYGSGNAKLFQYYRRVYEYVKTNYPDSPAAIFLDEDVEISPDFFYYMNQTIPLLQKDPSLYCINAFSSVRSNQLSFDPSIVMRGIAQVAWGYAVSLSFITEALGNWTTNSSAVYHFDTWLLHSVSHGRECVFPEQTRSLHFGALEGMNTQASFESESFGILLPLLRTYGIKLSNIENMIRPLWREGLANSIRTGKVVAGNPCSEEFLPKNESGTFVFYFKFIENDPEELLSFHVSGLCLGIWSLSRQGLHDAVFSLRPRNDSVLHMVGVPASSFSYSKPPEIAPWDFLSLNESEKSKSLMYKVRFENEEYQKVYNVFEKLKTMFRHPEEYIVT